MTDATFEDEDFEDYEEELGPSLAMPPLYVLRLAERCPVCGRGTHVYTLGCAAFHDAESSRPAEIFHFLKDIRSVPDELSRLLKARCPGYYADAEEEGFTPYLMNHCQCGAKLDDDYLHGDVGAAFFPDVPEGYEQIKLFRLPVEEPIPVECSWTVGGGEYLDFDGAEAW